MARRISAIERWGWRRRLIALFWIAAMITVAVLAYTGQFGWDSEVCWKAIQNVRHGNDPYAAGIASMTEFHRLHDSNSDAHWPLVYVYSPITLPLLRFLAVFPGWVLGVLWMAATAVGAGLQMWAGYQMADIEERRWLALLMPAAVFFPGLVTDDVILSGNVAYILYGLILASAIPGWKRGNWSWFYLSVLVASAFKAPFLALLAFPVLTDRRQWFPSCITAASGVLIFAAQSRIWPQMFREYMLSIRLMFDWEHDFGFGPAGMMGRVLWRHGLPYIHATSILYVVFACVLGILLLILARQTREWNISQKAWIPVALVGTILLNPRVMKYDLAAVTIPMLLIGWRTLQFARARSAGARDESSSNGHGFSHRAAIFLGAGCFLIPNVITVAGPTWFPTELMVIGAVFASGICCIVLSSAKVQRWESSTDDRTAESREVLTAVATSTN